MNYNIGSAQAYNNATLNQAQKAPPTPGSLQDQLNRILDILGRGHVHAEQVKEKLVGPMPEASAPQVGNDPSINGQLMRCIETATALADRIEQINGAL